MDRPNCGATDPKIYLYPTDPGTPPPDYTMPEVVQNSPKLKRTYKSATTDYLNTTSAHALPHVISHKTKAQKFFWFLIFWAAMAYSCYQLRGIVVEFRKYKVTVKTLVKHRTVAEFPAVTICNENKLKRSKIVGTPYQSIITLEDKMLQRQNSEDDDYYSYNYDYENAEYQDESRELQDYYNYDNIASQDDSMGSNDIFVGLRGEHDYERLFNLSKTTDYSDVINMLRPNTTELELYGHQKDDFILQCTFDGEDCKSHVFTKFYSDAYGNCYTFNGLKQNRSVISTTKLGSKYGLKLSLNVESEEYLGLFTHQIGARISVHPSNTTPFPEDNAVSAPVGFLTEVAFDTNFIESVKSPYETNCTKGEGIPLFYPGVYTSENCMHSCLRRMLSKTCRCVETVEMNQGENRCKISNITQVICRLNVYRKFKNNQYTCQQNCNEPCLQVTHNFLISYSQWPTDGYKALLEKQLAKKNVTSWNNENNYLEGNILRTHIYFRTLSYKLQEAFPTYTWETLLANIGGTWGLFVGFSVCTFLEALEYFLELLFIMFRSCCAGNKEQVSP